MQVSAVSQVQTTLNCAVGIERGIDGICDVVASRVEAVHDAFQVISFHSPENDHGPGGPIVAKHELGIRGSHCFNGWARAATKASTLNRAKRQTVRADISVVAATAATMTDRRLGSDKRRRSEPPSPGGKRSQATSVISLTAAVISRWMAAKIGKKYLSLKPFAATQALPVNNTVQPMPNTTAPTSVIWCRRSNVAHLMARTTNAIATVMSASMMFMEPVTRSNNIPRLLSERRTEKSL